MENSEVHLIQKTGISPNNYMYWASKEACDKWFLAKSIKKLEDYSYIRGDSVSKNGYNVGCVHVNLPYSDTTTCDYLSYKNAIFENRWFHCQIINREFVNADSCRLYFVIDYVASYWDTIELGKSFVERTHVGDDWLAYGVFTASKYLLPEPFAIEIRHRPELLMDEPFREANEDLFYDKCKFCMITTISDDGKINNPKVQYQSGGSISGYVYTGDQSEIEQKLTKYVSFSSQLVVRAESILNHVSSIYIAPTKVLDNTSNTPEFYEIDRYFNTFISPEDMVGVRHAKVLDYFRVRIIGNTNDILISPAQNGSRLWGNVYCTGGPQGCYNFVMNDAVGNNSGISCSTNNWPSVSISATVNAYDYQVNSKVKDMVSEGVEWYGNRENLRTIL